MIHKIATVTLLLFSLVSFSQKDTIVTYLDAKKKSFVDKESAHFTRKMIKVGDYFRVLYYEKKGVLISDETFLNGKLTKRVGTNKLYFGSGELQIFRQFNEQSELDGKFQTYYEDGSKNFGGVYKSGKKDGVWDYYYANGNKMALLFYNNGTVENYDLWNEDGTEKNEKLILERRPEFKGGQAALVNYIRKNLSTKFRKSKFRGRLILGFTINKEGKPEDINIRPKNLSERDVNSILRFFKKMPNWEPGIQLNRKVKVKYTLPVRIN